MSQPADLAEAVERALRAPSVHNTQPWLWRINPGVIELHADWTRHLAATDPDRRDVLLSCGAALHHLQVALAASNMVAHVHRLPNPENRDLRQRMLPATKTKSSAATVVPRIRHKALGRVPWRELEVEGLFNWCAMTRRLECAP